MGLSKGVWLQGIFIGLWLANSVGLDKKQCGTSLGV